MTSLFRFFIKVFGIDTHGGRYPLSGKVHVELHVDDVEIERTNVIYFSNFLNYLIQISIIII
jgi:hypothetical protein